MSRKVPEYAKMRNFFATVALTLHLLSGISEAKGLPDLVCTLNVTSKLIINPADTTFKKGDKVAFNCEAGYYLIGVEETVCTKDGGFRDNIPTCAPLCVKPRQLYLVANSDKESFKHGGSITLGCVNKYRLRAGVHSTRFCQINGEWDVGIEDNLCERVGCFSFPPLTNGKYHPKSSSDEPGPDGWYEAGTAVTYECNENYYLEGYDELYCARSGEFSSGVRKCIEIRCTEVINIVNGAYLPKESSYAVGSYIDYDCKTNYKLTTMSGRRFCTLNSDEKTASFEDPPECERIECSHPGSIINGQFNKQKVYYIGDAVKYICDPGYVLVGEDRNECELNANMVSAEFAPAPVCKPITCDDPVPPPNSKIAKGLKSSYSLGDEVDYECDDNFYLEGDNTAICQQNGIRSAIFTNVFVCQEIFCQSPMSVVSGHFSPQNVSYPIGSEVTYSCAENYKLVGAIKAICEKTGTQTAEFTDAPSCRPIVCDDPMSIDNGDFATKLNPPFNIGDVVSYVCDKGYVFATAFRTSTCTLHTDVELSFFTLPPSCRQIQCPPPPLPVNGGITFDSDAATYYPGDEVDYECIPSYAIEDGTDDSNECQDDGTWEKPVPNCLLKLSCYGRCGKSVAEGCLCDDDCADSHSKKCCKDFFQSCTRMVPTFF